MAELTNSASQRMLAPQSAAKISPTSSRPRQCPMDVNISEHSLYEGA